MIDVDTMINELRIHTGTDKNDPDWSNPNVLLLLNRSFWNILNRFDFREKETADTFDTVVGTYQYPVESDLEAFVGVSILDPTGQSDKLERIAESDWEHEFNNTEYSQPEFYFRKGNSVTLFPTPDDIYTIRVSRLINLSDLASGAIPPIPREWHELIFMGGVSRAFYRLGDMDRGLAFANTQEGTIEGIVPVANKEEADSQLAGINIILDPTSNGLRRKRLWR